MTTPAPATTGWESTGPHAARLVRTSREGDRTVLAEYRDGSDMDPVASPRPYLHPVVSAAGIPVTDVRPADHVHHMGVSVALPVVNGTSFWGGRTYVRDRGPTLLDNHGRQQPRATALHGPVLTQDLEYLDQRGEPLLQERRRVACAELPGGALALGWSSDLAAGVRELRLDSPATHGRAGAGYGGVLWRLGTADATEVLSAGGAGEETAHGSTSPWVAFVQRHGDAVVTLVLARSGTPGLPWFLRATEYDGACPAVAWDTTRVVPLGSTLHLGLVGAVVDRALDVPAAAALAQQAVTTLATVPAPTA